MAVAIDVTSSPHVATAVASISWTHTPSGTPTAVAITTYGFSVATTDTATCTYGGTTAPPATNGSDTVPDISYIFGLANPPSGAQTVLISFSNTNYPVASSITVTGSDTTTCFDNVGTPVSGTGTGAVTNVTCTSAIGDLVLSAFGVDGGALTGVGTQTDYMNAAANGGEQGSAGTQAGAASVTAQYTASTGGFVGLSASFKQSSGITAATPRIIGLASAEW